MILKRKWSNLGIAVGINILFFILAMAFCDVKYEVSDDFVMATIMSGAYGDSPNPQLIFVNTLLGYLLLPLYMVLSDISWYLIFQLLLCLISFILITYMLLERLDKHVALFFIVLLLTVFSDDVYILPQFTKTAALAVMAGGITFLWNVFYKKSVFLLITSFLVCLLGTWVRFSTIYIAGGFILFLLVHEYYHLMKERKYQDLIRVTILGMILIGSAVSSYFINIYTYQNDEASSYFRRYNTARANIVDQVDYGYESYKEELEKIGVSENDYYMLRNWIFGDNECFSLEKMEKIADIIGEYNSAQSINWENLYEQIQVRKISGYPIFWATVLILGLSIICQKKSYRYMLLFAIGVGLEIYFFIRGRVVYRVEYGIFISTFLSFVYLWNKENDRFVLDNFEVKKISFIFSIIVMLVQLPLYIPDFSYKDVSSEGRKQYIDNVFNASWNYNELKYRKVVNYERETNALITEIQSHQENFYLLDFGTTIQSLYYEWSPFQNLPIGYYNNNIYLAGVTSEFPSVNYILENRGIENPLKDLVKENVYLVDNYNTQLILSYIQEHYYPNVKVDLYKEAGGYQIWKFYLE